MGTKLNKKVPLWLFLTTLILAITGFTLWGMSNFNHYDQVYGLHAEEYFSKTRVLELLNENKVEEATLVLKSETENLGVAVAVCLMNDCSKKAKEVRDEFKNP